MHNKLKWTSWGLVYPVVVERRWHGRLIITEHLGGTKSTDVLTYFPELPLTSRDKVDSFQDVLLKPVTFLGVEDNGYCFRNTLPSPWFVSYPASLGHKRANVCNGNRL